MAVRLVVCRDLALESQDDSHVIVFNTASAARTKLSLPAYRFLKAFQTPRRIAEVVPDRSLLPALPQVRALIDKRMLVDADSPAPGESARLRTAVAYKFCNAPAYARSVETDFVILGAPYDLAGDIDSRLAPALIRRKSLDYSHQLEFAEGRPRGWFDVNRGVRVLQGATIADAGDVPVEYGESRSRYFDRVGAALAQCCTGRSVPVILGGDRSVTGAALGGLNHEGKLTVIQITADPDRAAAEGAGRHLLRMDKVDRVMNLGSDTLRERDPEQTVRAWGDGLSIYLSIDLGIVSEALTNAAAAGRPRAPTLHELKTSIAATGRAHRIVGIDLVGLDLGSPSPELTAIVGCHLALFAMSAAYDRI